MSKKLPPHTTEDIKRRRDELFEALSRESDRGLVLVSASFLDEALELLLRERFSAGHVKPRSAINPLFDTFGPLSTFSSKIKIAYAIDLIGKWVYQDLEILRKLRNLFAHSIEKAVFDSHEVIRLTEKLKGADHAVAVMTKDTVTKKPQTEEEVTTNDKEYSKADMERTRLLMTVPFIGAALYAKAIIFKIDDDISLEEKLYFVSILVTGL